MNYAAWCLPSLQLSMDGTWFHGECYLSGTRGRQFVQDRGKANVRDTCRHDLSQNTRSRTVLLLHRKGRLFSSSPGMGTINIGCSARNCKLKVVCDKENLH